MPIPDREDRAAAAKSQVAARERKKVKVKRKPLPVPSLTIEYQAPRPKPRPTQPVGPGKSRPQQHLPTQFEFLSPEQFGHRALGVETAEERSASRQRNQAREAERRADARAEREARKRRRAEVQKLDRKARQFIGHDRLNDYIQHGPKEKGPGFLDIAEAVGRGVLDKGAELTTDFTSRLSAGLRGRESGREIRASDDPFLSAVGDVVLGPNVMKAAAGEDYDRTWLGAELALLAVPIKGLPTPITAALRALVGTQKLLAAEKAGLTVAEAVETLTRPLSEVRAARRLRIAGEAARGERRASSWVAKTLSGDSNSLVARAIRNDPSARRVYTDGDGVMETGYALSRTGKAAQKIIDRYRAGLSRTRLVKDERSKYAELLVQRADVAARQYEALAASLARYMPRDMLHRVDWPAVYAVRSVLKGVPVSDAIARHEAELAQHLADGETLKAIATQHHLAYYRAAEPMVVEFEDGVRFSEQAPQGAREFADQMVKAGEAREQILEGLGLLDEATAQARVLNEQLYYQTGKLMPQGDAVDKAIRSNPVFKEAEKVFKQQNPKTADHALTVYAANARRWYEGQIQMMQTKIEQIEEALAADPSSRMAERWKQTIADLEQRIKDMKPDAYFDTALKGGVKAELPAKVVDTESEMFGRLGEDWYFSLSEGDKISPAAKAIAKEINAAGLKLPPELDTEEKLAAGIEAVFALAREGEEGKDWYKTAANGVKIVADHTGVPVKQVAQLFAIFSQAADTVSNSTFVFDAIRQYQKYGDVFTGRFPVRQSEEALAVLRGGKWEGRKRSSFYANILRHIPGMEDEYAATLKEMAFDRGSETNPVTVDRWVVRMFSESLGDVPGSYYDSFEKIMQAMAKHVGWEPEQLQAAAWVAKKDQALQAELAAGGRENVRHKAGAPDAFEFGIERQLERERQGELFGVTSGDVTPQAKRLANQANKKWGGFTVDRNLQPVPEEGYVVTQSLTETSFPLHKLTGADIEQFAERYAALLKDKRNVIGGFSDDANDFGDGTEITYLSVSRQFKSKAAAMRYAREQGQETFYEYKTGDGIRTGLTRDEQAEIIRNLDPSATRGGPVMPPPKTSAEQEYDAFLGKAALDMLITKAGKKPTVSQKARAEEWLLQHAHEYPDEPIIKEWEALLAKKPPREDPAWMLEQAIEGDRNTAFKLGGGDVTDDAAEQIVGQRGDDVARHVPGWEQAVADMEQGIVPADFVKFVTDSKMGLYEKYAVGRAMDRVLRKAGHEKFTGRPGTDSLGWAPDKLHLGGMFDAGENTIYASPTSRSVDYIHELMHANEFNEMFPPALRAEMWKFVGADPMQAKLTEQQSEDMVDMFEAMLLGYDQNLSHLPLAVKRAFQAISDEMNVAMRDTSTTKYSRAAAMLKRLPEDVRLRLEDTFWYAEQQKRTGRYVPEVPGLPISFKDTVLGVQRYPALYRRVKAGSKVSTLTPTDKALEKSFTGALLKSGLWDRDVTKGTMNGLIKAIEIQKMHTLREGLLKTGTDVPTSIYDIAVPVDPKEFAQKSKAELGSLFRLFDVMDSGAKVTEQELDKVTLQGIEQAKDYFFPGMSDGTARAVQEIADLVMSTAKPIDGVKWVKRDMLEKVHLFEPQAFSTTLKGTRSGKALSTIDFANNIAKNYTLTWNPAYYPMNMAGMGVMMMSHQGAFAPVTLIRGLVGMRDLGDDVHLIDLFAGQGLASIIHTGQHGALGKFTNAGAKASEILIDRYPRRAAFLFEARRLGYKTNDQVRALMLDPANIDDLVLVSRRTNKAMVDFGRMSRFEKEFVTRAIFVYPWLRGSTKYALNFPLDHPVQTALFGMLLTWQQQRLRDQFPEGQPGYLKWYLPIKTATGGEPGQTPYGFRMDQLFTPLQTLDLAAEITFWVAPGKWDMPWGSNEESMVTKLNPLYEEILKTVTGWDSFTQQEVSKGIVDMFKRLADPRERWATWDRLKRVLDGKTHEGIYDTTQTQNWLRVFMGSLAPINVDPVAAGERAQPTRTITIEDKSDQQRLDEWVQDATRLGGSAPPPEVVALKEADMAYDDVYAEYRREEDIDTGLTPQETLIVLVRTMVKLHPEKEAAGKALEERAKTLSDDDAEDAISEGREKLGLTAFERIDNKLSTAREKERVGG